MRVVTIELEAAEKILRDRRQNYERPKGARIVKVHALEDDGVWRGVAIWARVDDHTAKRVHIFTDGSPLGWTMLYGQGCRALGSDGFTTIIL